MESELANVSAREGRLLFEVDANSTGAAAYYSVAAEIAERLAARRQEAVVKQAS
jgi:cellulose biosynthesis protein BcsQ